MALETRWQDGVTAVLGAILFIAPFAFGDTSQAAAAWTAWTAGALLFVLGGAMLLAPRVRTSEYLPLILGALLFLAPWVLGFSGLAVMARSSWIIGVLAFLTAGSTLVGSTTTDRRATAQ
jgi:SPW repeat